MTSGCKTETRTPRVDSMTESCDSARHDSLFSHKAYQRRPAKSSSTKSSRQQHSASNKSLSRIASQERKRNESLHHPLPTTRASKLPADPQCIRTMPIDAIASVASSAFYIVGKTVLLGRQRSTSKGLWFTIDHDGSLQLRPRAGARGSRD